MSLFFICKSIPLLHLLPMEVLEAATDAPREYAVEENYMSTYRESAIFLSKRVEENEKNIRVFNINQRTIDNRSSDPHDRNREAKCDADNPSRDLTQQTNFRRRRAVPIVCYNFRQQGHISRNFMCALKEGVRIQRE